MTNTEIIEQVSADFMTAFKAKDLRKKNFLGVLKSEIATQGSKANGGLDPLQVVKSMEKALVEDGSEDAQVELEYLKPYIPSLMSKESVKEIVTSLIDNGANHIGQIMKEFSTTYKGQADNSVVREVVSELL